MLASTKTVTLAPRPHDPFTTNICFGGADLRTAYVTLSGNDAVAVLTHTEVDLRDRFHLVTNLARQYPKVHQPRQ